MFSEWASVCTDKWTAAACERAQWGGSDGGSFQVKLGAVTFDPAQFTTTEEEQEQTEELCVNKQLSMTFDPGWPHVYCQHIPHLLSPWLPGGQSYDWLRAGIKPEIREEEMRSVCLLFSFFLPVSKIKAYFQMSDDHWETWLMMMKSSSWEESLLVEQWSRSLKIYNRRRSVEVCVTRLIKLEL